MPPRLQETGGSGVIPQVERQLLLGWQRKNRILQLHGLRIGVIHIFLIGYLPHFPRFVIINGDNVIAPFAYHPESLIGGDSVNPHPQRTLALEITSRAEDTDKSFLSGILSIRMMNHHSPDMPIHPLPSLIHKHPEARFGVMPYGSNYFCLLFYEHARRRT